MIDVTVKIAAIIMYCDESILSLELGNGYTIEKCYLNDFPFKSDIENGKNQLNIEYMGSRLYDKKGIYFIPASNEPSGCLQTFDDCREGQIPRPLGRCKFDAPLLAAGSLTCLKKEDTFQIEGSQLIPGAVITDKDCQCEDEIGVY